MTDTRMILERLARSKFRSSFHLKQKDLEYIEEKGMDVIMRHSDDIIRKRLAPAYIENDGKQTPMKGHPVFIAQHATACCCRGCLNKWYGIEKGRELTETEIRNINRIIEAWIMHETERSSETNKKRR